MHWVEIDDEKVASLLVAYREHEITFAGEEYAHLLNNAIYVCMFRADIALPLHQTHKPYHPSTNAPLSDCLAYCQMYLQTTARSPLALGSLGQVA